MSVDVTVLERFIRISVRDRGRGIPQEAIPNLFDRFYQVDSSDSRERGGTGLGLSIVKSIIDAHGGTIDVESELGVGTTFNLEFLVLSQTFLTIEGGHSVDTLMLRAPQTA